MRGAGRAVFAAVMLLLLGVLNVIYGIAALDKASVLVNDTRLIISSLNTVGWITILIGVIQIAGGVSLLKGNIFGRVIGVIGGTIGAVVAMIGIGGAFPWWSLAIFALCIWVVWGILVLDEDEYPTA